MIIEIDVSDTGISKDDQPRWEGVDTLVAEGETLDELLDDAEVFFRDQDGGETNSWKIGEFTKSQYEMFEKLITDEFNKLT